MKYENFYKLFLFIILVGSPKASFGNPNIFGADHREPLSDQNLGKDGLPIGRVLISSPDPSGTFFMEGSCTGTIVSDYLILTAAHCVTDTKTGKPIVGFLNFTPGYKENPKTKLSTGAKPYAVKVVALGTQDVKKDGWNLYHDWAILKAAEPIGTIFGSLGVRNLDFSKPDNFKAWRQKFTQAGYSNDYLTKNGVFGIHSNCSIYGQVLDTEATHNVTAGLLFHDCDMVPGASGGPMLSYLSSTLEPAESGVPLDDYHWYVVGINVAEINAGNENLPFYDGNSPNIATPVIEASQALNLLMEQ